ncbi:MAG: hypothetical protein Q9224_005643, partial [Gallowayella concinna]
AEQDRNEHGQAESPVDSNAEEDCAWYDHCRSFDLFCHVDCRIGSYKGISRPHETDEERVGLRVPATQVHKRPKHILGIGMWCKICQWNQNGNKSHNMKNQDKAFELRQERTCYGVDRDGKGKYGPGQQRVLPSPRHVVLIAKSNQTLNQDPGIECT